MVQDMSAPSVAYGAPAKPAHDKTVLRGDEVQSPKLYSDSESDLLAIALIVLVLIAGLLVVLHIRRRGRGLGRGLEIMPRAYSAPLQLEHAAAGPVQQGSRTARGVDDDRTSSTAADEPRRHTEPTRLVPGAERTGAAGPRRDAANFDGHGAGNRPAAQRRTEPYAAARGPDANDTDRRPAYPPASDAWPHQIDAKPSDAPRERLSLEQRVTELQHTVHELEQLRSTELAQLAQLHGRVAELEARLAELSRPPADERASSVIGVAFRQTSDDTATSGPQTLENRMLQIWNGINWDQARPSLSVIETVLQCERYELIEGILGTYALAVPARSGDDARAPVYVLPILGKANKMYDGWLFERPLEGDSATLRRAAKVRFSEGGTARSALERLKAGNEKLNQVFTVIQPGRIE
jgi:hypothetical protein